MVERMNTSMMRDMPREIVPKREVKKSKETIGVHYEILLDPEMRKNLLERMDQFIKNILKTDVQIIVFLDKSARPLSWLFQKRFQKLFPEKEMPKIHFINIGGSDVGHEGYNLEHDEAGSDEITTKVSHHTKEQERVRNACQKTFDNKNVMVVDELALSGNSLSVAKELLKQTFPKMKRITTEAFFLAG